MFLFFYLFLIFVFLRRVVFLCRGEKEAKREEKLLIKQLEKDKREAEKEKKKLERELLKEKCQSVSAALY